MTTTPAPKTIPPQSGSRIPFIDLLRILACFLVIVNHTNSNVFLALEPSVTWFLSLFYFFACKIAVPLFLMITGYTLLDRQDTYCKSFQRFLRTGFTLFLFSAVCYVNFIVFDHLEDWGILSFFSWLITYPITNAYWYLYTYLGILLMMPFLQKLAASFQKTDFHVFFFFSGAVFAFWPIVVHYIPQLELCNEFSLPILSSNICLLFLGCYLKRYSVASAGRRNLALLGFVLCCGISTLLTYAEYFRCDGTDYLFYDKYTLLPVIVSSVCIFYAASTLSFSERSAKRIISFGSLTFGIYLLSDILISRFDFLRIAMLELELNPLLCIIPFELLVFLLGALLTFLLKKIPFIRTLL